MIGFNTLSTTPSTTDIINRAGEAAQSNVVPSTTDPSLVTPEDVNTAVDNAEQQVNSAQQTRETTEENQRTAALQINAQQQQQDQVDLFVEISSGEDIDSGNTVDINTLASLSRSSQRNQFATALEQRQTDPVNTQTLEQQELQNRFQQAIGDNQTPPTIEVVV